jgi:putative transposase
VHGKINHPQTQAKTLRYHRSMKNVVKRDNYFFPTERQQAFEQLVNDYNLHRYHAL